MFGIGRVARARKGCVQALRSFVIRPDFMGPWPSEFWRGPYVLGFTLFVTSTVSNIVSGGKLSQAQRGKVLTGAMKDVGAPPIFLIGSRSIPLLTIPTSCLADATQTP